MIGRVAATAADATGLERGYFDYNVLTTQTSVGALMLQEIVENYDRLIWQYGSESEIKAYVGIILDWEGKMLNQYPELATSRVPGGREQVRWDWWGENGTGKSTLLKLFCGEEYPDEGKLEATGTMELMPKK